MMQLTSEYQYLFLLLPTIPLYLLYLAFYRYFLHSLSHIPGPLLPKITTWHECYYEFFLPGKHPWQLKAMHKTHGPIIRPVPDEVHIDDPDFLDTIYATRNRNQVWSGGLMIDESIAGAEEYSHHKMRRDALSPYFSAKAVLNLGALLTEKRDRVVSIFDEALGSGEVMNVADVVFAFANDLVKTFCFGFDDALLEDLPEAKKKRESLRSLLEGVPLHKHFPWVARGLSGILGFFLGSKALPPTILDMLKFRSDVGNDIQAIFADKANDRKNGNSIFYELRDSEILPPEEKTLKRLLDEATILTMAGTESPAKSLSIAVYYIFSQPEVLSKLRQELAAAYQQAKTSELPLKTLMTLPYMSAVCEEANRLSFGVTKRLVRYSPTETFTYTASYGPHKGQQYILPPGTRMSTVTYCTHTNEDLFPDPWTFDPERWLTEDESDKGSHPDVVKRRKRCHMALGKGHRVCLGRHVAAAEMSLFLEAVAKYDMRLYETDESDVKFQHDFQISHPRRDSQGIRAVVEGKHSQ